METKATLTIDLKKIEKRIAGVMAEALTKSVIEKEKVLVRRLVKDKVSEILTPEYIRGLVIEIIKERLIEEKNLYDQVLPLLAE